MKILRNKFLQDNIIFIFGTFFVSLANYFYHFFISRRVTVAEYGEFQNLLAFFAIFSVLNSALSYFVVKYVAVFAEHEDYASSREFTRLLVSKVTKLAFLLLLVIFIISPGLKHIFHFSSLWGLLIIGATVFFSTISVVYLEVLRSWQKFLALTLFGAAAAAVKLFGGIGLAMTYPSAAAISFSLLLAVLAGWFLSKIYCQKKIGIAGGNSETTTWRKKYFSDTSLKKAAVKISIFSLGVVLVTNLDIVLVKMLVSPEKAGYYGAFSLLGKIILWLSGAVTGVILPTACTRGFLGKRPAKKQLGLSYLMITFIGLVLTAAYFLIPEFFINLFFGKKFIVEASSLWLFGLMAFFLSLLTLEANLSFAKNDFRVVYFLGSTVLFMVLGVSVFHASLREIALVFSGSLGLGYFSVLALNLAHKKSLGI